MAFLKEHHMICVFREASEELWAGLVTQMQE